MWYLVVFVIGLAAGGASVYYLLAPVKAQMTTLHGKVDRLLGLIQFAQQANKGK